ncbi:MAG TPA: hypothetical protein VGT61_08295 [Thermomicrobiales bacterium]|nr:hypothetical protein [Thermomicrobiales bacterium]
MDYEEEGDDVPFGMEVIDHCLTRMDRRHATRLLNQQFWLFGHDVRRPDGNLLIASGLERTRRDDGRPTASSYAGTLSCGAGLRLWGFGAALSVGERAIFVPRSRYTARITTVGSVKAAAREPEVGNGAAPPMPDLRMVRTGEDRELVERALPILLGWFADYERGVVANAGAVYRHQAWSAWKRPCGTACGLAAEWDRLRSLIVIQEPVATLGDRSARLVATG